MQSTSNSIQGFSAALCAMSNPAAQLTLLFENSVRHTVSTYLCNSASGTISKTALLLCWQGCRGRGKGHVKHLEFGTFSPASDSPGFPWLCMFMCKKYSVSECEQPRTPDTENGAPKCELKIVIIMMDFSVRSN